MNRASLEPPTLWRNARLALCDRAGSRVAEGALLTHGGVIEWAGRQQELPSALTAKVRMDYDLKGAWVTPGLIDCHTHLVFAGTRAAEYGERLRGASYEDIARRGGGILTTVRATRAATDGQLFDEAAPRLAALLAEGVTTVEVKSGYGLTLADEARMLRTARRLGEAFPVTIRTTLLAAHALPPEYAGRADAYIDVIAGEWLPLLHGEGLVDAVDVFCESASFSAVQAGRLFDAAGRLGLPVKMHAEQRSRIGGSLLAAGYGAMSCDHLEYSTAEDARAMAAAGTVAVLLPVAFYCLGEKRLPPIQAFRTAGTPMAVATDCNPGSAPVTSLLLALNMAGRLFGLTPEEGLAGVTTNAALALGLAGPPLPRRMGVSSAGEESPAPEIRVPVGTLARGFAADFSVWGIRDLEELGYWTGYNPCRAVVKTGRLVRGSLG